MTWTHVASPSAKATLRRLSSHGTEFRRKGQHVWLFATLEQRERRGGFEHARGEFPALNAHGNLECSEGGGLGGQNAHGEAVLAAFVSRSGQPGEPGSR